MLDDRLLLERELTVTELTGLIKSTLEGSFYGLKVTGELSNFRPASTGHWFFSLKDGSSVIGAVMFKGDAWRVAFSPKEGDKITVTGSIDVYGPRGTYQIRCKTMERSGSGDILAMLEEQKRHYAAAGYFEAAGKQPIPRHPTRVGVVTSPTGAALQDILQVLARRAPSLDVLVLPAVVQGESAPATIAARIEQANALLLCDVLIVGRGGGSLEDLLPFSSPRVIEAIHDSTIPIVSAVGHEIDWALSDFVADLRAPTPSAAAELVSQGLMEERMALASHRTDLARAMQGRLAAAKTQVSRTAVRSLVADMRYLLQQREFHLANATDGIVRAQQNRLMELGNRIHLASERLQALSPLAILARGYSVVTDKQGRPVVSRADVDIGDEVGLRFSDGRRNAIIRE